MDEEDPKQRKGYSSVAALVKASCSEGICPDLLNLMDLQELDTTGSASTGSVSSNSSYSSSPFSPAPSRSPILGRRFAHRLSSQASPVSSPGYLDSPDSVFNKTPKTSSKFGLFSALMGRRCSAPVTQNTARSPRHELRSKPGLLAIPEQGVGKRAASVSDVPVRIVISSSAEFSSSRSGSGSEGKLRKRREFGSTGDLLDGSTELKVSFRQQLGKSMEHVSEEHAWICGWEGEGGRDIEWIYHASKFVVLCAGGVQNELCI